MHITDCGNGSLDERQRCLGCVDSALLGEMEWCSGGVDGGSNRVGDDAQANGGVVHILKMFYFSHWKFVRWRIACKTVGEGGIWDGNYYSRDSSKRGGLCQCRNIVFA